MSSQDVLLDHGVQADLVLHELVLSLEQGELQDARGLHDVGLDLLHELDSGHHRPSRRDEVVHQHDPISLLDVPHVHLDPVRTVLERVLLADRLPGKLFGLSQRNESALESKGERSAENQSSGLEPRHHVHLLVLVPLVQNVDAVSKGHRVQQGGRDVLEQDALLGPVRDRTNRVADVAKARVVRRRHHGDVVWGVTRRVWVRGGCWCGCC
mmetsp:Transcript_2538/g.7746  ORF Transcript_2538/g.7746 Transcript_2538/m.7746 type:complete len:211 (+) Transcript_2538:161-793(+)